MGRDGAALRRWGSRHVWRADSSRAGEGRRLPARRASASWLAGALSARSCLRMRPASTGRSRASTGLRPASIVRCGAPASGPTFPTRRRCSSAPRRLCRRPPSLRPPACRRKLRQAGRAGGRQAEGTGGRRVRAGRCACCAREVRCGARAMRVRCAEGARGRQRASAWLVQALRPSPWQRAGEGWADQVLLPRAEVGGRRRGGMRRVHALAGQALAARSGGRVEGGRVEGGRVKGARGWQRAEAGA